MITGSNRQQRPGGSYMHGVLRDAARPFAYRGSARRLLHAQGSSGVRPVYGNGFMPVDFKYLITSYGYEYGTPALSSPPAVPGYPQFGQATARVNETITGTAAAVSSAMPDKPGYAQQASEVAHNTPHKTPHKTPQKADKPQAAPVLDIRIPGGDVQKKPAMTVPAQMERSTLSDAGSAAAPQPPQAQPKPGVGAALPQRMPADLSLTALARMLEQHNFKKPGAAPGTGLIPAAEKKSVPAIAESNSELHEAPGLPEENRRMPGLPNKTTLKKLVAGSSAGAARPSAAAAAKISARPAALKLPAPRRASPPDKHTHDAAQRQPAPQSQGRSETALARQPARAPRHKPAKSSRRVALIRRSAPAAFWERSYLSRPELRMYR